MRAGAGWLVLLGVLSACLPGSAGPPATPTPVATALPTPAPYRPSGASRVEAGAFKSAALGRTMPYFVYVPPGYDETSAQRYPVLYLLHGLSGSNQEWLDYGLQAAADELIRAGQLAPLLIVLPQGDVSYWVDHAGAAGPKWGTYTAVDVVREVDARYRTLADREDRAIGGLSMGAHGALQLALNYPTTFAIVGAHSVTLRTFAEAPPFFGNQSQFAQRDPPHLVVERPAAARSLAIWLDMGDADPWLASANSFHRIMDDHQIPHVWRISPGDHSAEYWSGNLRTYFGFYSAAFCGTAQIPGRAPVPRATPPAGCLP